MPRLAELAHVCGALTRGPAGVAITDSALLASKVKFMERRALSRDEQRAPPRVERGEARFCHGLHHPGLRPEGDDVTRVFSSASEGDEWKEVAGSSRKREQHAVHSKILVRRSVLRKPHGRIPT